LPSSLSSSPIQSIKNTPVNTNNNTITVMNLEALMTSKPCGSCGSK
jgi:hypothetical protein